MVAMNQGLNEAGKNFEGEWTWIAQQDVDIDNFHIKNALIYDDKLLIFSRGKPRDVLEECCSFLLILKLKIEDGNIKGIEGFGLKDAIEKSSAQYKYIKLDPLVYPQFLSRTWVSRREADLVLRVVQEDNYSESFPNQVFEMAIPNCDMETDQSLVNT